VSVLVAVISCLLLGVPGVARADGVNDLPPVTDDQIARAVNDLRLQIDDLRLRVDDVDATTIDAGETVVTLKSDVLFAFGKASLSGAAKRRIGELAEKAPRKARVKVYGHTDSIGSTGSNRSLSRARARAVAGAIRAARPDLRLEVQGFGEARPVEPNRSGGKDNPEGRAANRRVEIRYGG
jgi:outer membrane protein OmpA-like peptidoglycan-associated protein